MINSMKNRFWGTNNIRKFRDNIFYRIAKLLGYRIMAWDVDTYKDASLKTTVRMTRIVIRD
jgi:hypothetical protein